MNVVRGCNCPLLIKTIRSELEKEHKVMDGTSDRVPVSRHGLCYEIYLIHCGHDIVTWVWVVYFCPLTADLH